MRAQLSLAIEHGADLRCGEKVHRVANVEGRTIVETDRARYAAGTTIVAAGPWMLQLLPTFAKKLTVRRQVLYWFERTMPLDVACSYLPQDFPVFIWHWGDGADDVFYGFPQIDASGTIKVATEQHVSSTTPDVVERDVKEAEIAAMYATHISGKLRGVGPHSVKATTCLYTDTADANFIIGRLPNAQDTIVISACSGHGFKHSAAIGEAVAQMAAAGGTPAMLQPFSVMPP